VNESSLAPRFEVLPVGRSDEEAAQLPEPMRLTVTCSPRHGPDESLDMARRLRRHGHAVTVHLAARMVRNPTHLDELLSGMADAGVDDVFLIGGDATPPLGPYSSAIELLPLVYAHPRPPRKIGVAGYPEGHPLIGDEELAEALDRKSACASYITTQMCFDPEAVLGWIARTRERGVTLPVLVGVPGVVDRRRLLKVAMRIGVGPSLSFVRKQRGLRSLLAKSKIMPDPPYEVVASALDDRDLGIAGFHFYTFNQLCETWKWHCERTQSDLFEEVVTT
jgi:methylenetetrahydrofolate reductase (NADPH)